MLIKVNGVVSEIADDISIQGFIAARKLPGDSVIAVLNGDVIPRQFWETTPLKSSDSLDVVRIMGGG